MSSMEAHYHPAGFDEPLRGVLDDVRAGRWRSMRDLLADTHSLTLRTSRSQVLAAAAAGGDAVEAWGLDVRDDNWMTMRARVLVQRALHAHRDNTPGAPRLEATARGACQAAIKCRPNDPVPWVDLLALARTDAIQPWQRRPEHHMPSWEPGLPHGPWGLLAEVLRRDPESREGWHRMLQALTAYKADVTDFVRWGSAQAPKGSPRAVLPLYVYVQIYRDRQRTPAGAPLFWTTNPVTYYTERAATHWFAHADKSAWSTLDLNYTAQALHSGGLPEMARQVFEAIGPHVTPAPWSYVADAPHRWLEEFQRARRHTATLATHPRRTSGRW